MPNTSIRAGRFLRHVHRKEKLLLLPSGVIVMEKVSLITQVCPELITSLAHRTTRVAFVL